MQLQINQALTNMTEKEIIYSKDPTDLLAQYADQEGSLFIILCESGKMQINNINEDESSYELQKDDMLICHPNFLVGQYKCSADFTSKSACVLPRALYEILYACMRNTGDYWHKTQFIARHPIIHINDEQKEIINALVVLVSACAKKDNNKQLSRMYRLIGQFASLAVLSWMDESTSFNQYDNFPTKHKDQILHRYMELLQQKHGVEREVKWYAKQLNITPKYLSVITKSKLNMTAQQMIQQIVCQEIKRQLCETNDTIKEIAYKMDFSSTTFFCKYVRHHLGCSPQTLRRQLS